MRVTNAMMMNQALYDLGNLRQGYAKAQAAVNGRSLERPSEDPQRVVEAMDLSGTKLRLERTQRAGQDAREWQRIAENGVSVMIDIVQEAKERAVQAGSTATLDPQARETMAITVESLRDALLQQMNAKHRDQYLFSGWKTGTKPFDLDPVGAAKYNGDSGETTREVAPGLSVGVNISGDNLMTGGDPFKVLTDMAADLRANRIKDVTGKRLDELNGVLNHMTVVRSDLGVRQAQVERYENFAQDALLHIEERLGQITGTDLETAVLKMTESQSAYQAALSSFAKALPTSLMDYLK